MRTILEIPKLPSHVVLSPPLTDEEFEKLCAANQLVQLERAKDGTIIVNPPTGAYTSDGNREIIYQLSAWWRQHRRGRVFDSNAGFFLPDGSSLSPDVAYATPEQLEGVSKEEFNHFLHLAPAFVVELLSYNDSLPKAKQKMELWLANGSQLGWLVDPYSRTVLVYEGSDEPRSERGDRVLGTGPVQGFVLDLTEVWSRYE